jgi:selenoprotein W-related protein
MSKPRVEIRYCPKCGWLLRSAWMAQELLTTFTDELQEVALAPGASGEFQVHVDGRLIWCRSRDGGFPDIKQLKRMVRDEVAPGRDLGHTDQSHPSASRADAESTSGIPGTGDGGVDLAR